jgi:hypothetical protein
MDDRSTLVAFFGVAAMKKLTALISLCLALLAAGPALASYPTALYVLVEEVQVGPPGAGEPEWIKVRGIFMNEIRGRPITGDEQWARRWGARRGWAHFKLPADPAKRALALIEWKDLEQAAAEHAVVAFGSVGPRPILQQLYVGVLIHDTPVPDAVEYPVDHGMHRMGNDTEPARQLEVYRASNPVPQ